MTFVKMQVKWSLTLTDRLGHHVQEMDRETAVPTSTWKLFTLTIMEKSKAEKSPRIKERKKTGQKKKEIDLFCEKKKKKALGLAKRFRQSRHLLKIWSRR